MQKSKSFRKTSSPMSLLAVPIQQKAKKQHPKAASAAMPRRQKHGVDNPKRRGCAPPFWSLGGAGGEIETPPAFLLGVPKGEVLF